MADNFMAGNDAANTNNRLLIKPMKERKPENYIVDKPFRTDPVTTDSPAAAREKILAQAGAVLPARDTVDQRLVQQATTGSGRVIDSQTEVGAWPSYPQASPYQDDNQNGMADSWELKNHVTDPNADQDRDGYTNLEEFLNGTNPATRDEVVPHKDL